MNIHNTLQSYTPPVANIGMHQHLSGKRAGELFNWFKPARGAGRLALVICLLTAAINLSMGGYVGHLSRMATELEGQRHELMDQNITLRATRASMMTSQSIERLAGEKLSLQKAGAGQVFVYSSSKQRFETVQ